MMCTETCDYLERHDATRNMARYYSLSIQPNLFGGWSLVREWGRIGSSGRIRIDLHDSEDEALAAYGKMREAKVRRGYSAKAWKSAA